MKTADLTSAANELQAHLCAVIKCYYRVGWMRGDKGAELVVFYDQRESIPSRQIPIWWRGIPVRLERTLPPGVKPPEDDLPLEYVWMVM